MYMVIGDPGGLMQSYDNIRKKHKTINPAILFCIASHTVRMASKATRPCSTTSTKLKRRHDRYMDLDGESDHPPLGTPLHAYHNDDTHNSWRRGLKSASIGHIVLGWASKLIRITSDPMI